MRTLALLFLLGCAGGRKLEAPERNFTLLTTNDIYRPDGLPEEGLGGIARLRALRAELEAQDEDVLVLHAGDLLYPSLLSRIYKGEQMIDLFNQLDGDPSAMDERLWVAFGNHEFDESDLEDAPGLDARIDQSQFHWLETNFQFKTGTDGQPLVGGPNVHEHAIVEVGGVKVGLFGVTIDSKVPDYVESFQDPIEAAREACAALRSAGAEVIVGVTHLDMAEDLSLLETLGAAGPDLIIGGHDHARQSGERGGRWVYKADADALTANVIVVSLDSAGLVDVAHRYAALGPEAPTPDPVVAARAADWVNRFDAQYCADRLSLPADCMNQVLGRTTVRLVAEETRIRRYETNLGAWVADQMLAAFADQGAQVAFVNAGGLRLNHDLGAGATLTRRHLEELIAYPTALKLVRIDGATLAAVTGRAVQEWTGGGHWLQIGGFAYVHDPATTSASGLTLLGPQGPRAIAPDETLLAVVPDFLLNPKYGQDGYTMLSPASVIAEGPDLKAVLTAALARAEPAGISPAIEGRICNNAEPGPCLALR